MKKIFLTFATAALFSVSAFATGGGKKANVSTVNASYAVQHQFAMDFSDAENVTWTVTKNSQRAEFTIDGVKKTAFYNLAGDFLGTTQVIGYNAIPAKTKKQIAEQYKGYVADGVIVYQANESLSDTIDPISYFVDLKSNTHEVLVRVTGSGAVEFFQQVY